ncbi:hypothetical protein ACN28S_05360 [Cystobacter fuscus]
MPTAPLSFLATPSLLSVSLGLVAFSAALLQLFLTVALKPSRFTARALSNTSFFTVRSFWYPSKADFAVSAALAGFFTSAVVFFATVWAALDTPRLTPSIRLTANPLQIPWKGSAGLSEAERKGFLRGPLLPRWMTRRVKPGAGSVNLERSGSLHTRERGLVGWEVPS